MATAKKLPSGNYRIRVYLSTDSDGKKHYKSFTAPTKKEAERLANNFTGQTGNYGDMKLIEMLESYVEDKEYTLSTSTIKGYKADMAYWKPLHHVRVKNLDQKKINAFLNEFAKEHSPKTCRNAFNIYSSALHYHGMDIDFKPNLPERVAIEYSIPTEEEFQKIVNYAKETDHEMYKCILLAAIVVMRRSEVCGLRHCDFKGNIVHIHTNMVSDRNQYSTKSTKNVSSDRYVEIPNELLNILDIRPNSAEFVVKLNPGQVTNRFVRILKKLDVKKCRYHDLRHYGASLMHAIGVPDQYVMARGGWSSDKVLKQVYRNTMDDYTRKFADIANEKFKNIF